MADGKYAVNFLQEITLHTEQTAMFAQDKNLVYFSKSVKAVYRVTTDNIC